MRWQGLAFSKWKHGAGVAENQLLHRLFDTPSPWNIVFCKLLIISNNISRTCVQRVSETFAEKVVKNTIAGMVQRCWLQSLALRRKAVSACNCRRYKKCQGLCSQVLGNQIVLVELVSPRAKSFYCLFDLLNHWCSRPPIQLKFTDNGNPAEVVLNGTLALQNGTETAPFLPSVQYLWTHNFQHPFC